MADNFGILDIPDIALMSVTSLEELRELYKSRLGSYPRAVSLPITSAGGVTYDSSLGINNVCPEVGGERYDLTRLITEALRYELDIYFVVGLTLPFATNSADFNLVDSVGDETAKCCVVNPFTQDVLREIISESFNLSQRLGARPTSYVFVVQDLWPMGAKGDLLELTCFCKHCREALSQTPGLDLDIFKSSPNPWNLALRDTGSGISHLNDIQHDDQPLKLLEKSKSKGLYNPQWFSERRQEEIWARQLYLYIHARDEITRKAISNVKSAVPENVPTILMADAFDYDWTSGMFFSTVLDLSTEGIWLPPTSSPKITQSSTTYMVSRGRYLVDALFELVSYITRTTRLDPTGSSTDRPDVRLNFVSRSTKLLQALHFSRMEILPVKRQGREFVVPVFTDDILRRLMDKLGLEVALSISQLAQLAEFLRRLGTG